MPGPTTIERRTSGFQTAVEQRVQTIEQTSKRYKGAMLAGALVGFFGLLLFMGGAQVLGGLVMTGGVIYYFYGRFGAWWHHA